MYKITSRFGQQESFRVKPHSGYDFKMEIGEPIRSIKEGVVRIHDFGNVNAGKTVFVEWEDGKTAIYGHLNDFAVQNGQHVQAGDLLGHAGNTGFSTGSHLHFGLKENGHFIDPSPYIEKIQHMNDPTYFVQQSADMVNLKVNFFDYMSQHMNSLGGLFTDMKIQFIHLFISTDYTPFIKLIQHILQFIFFYS